MSVFKAPHSYTGENTAEISCHGGIYVTRRVLSALTMLELDGYVAQSGGKRFSIQVELKE